MGDFPCNRTNINNLKSEELEELIFFENKKRIDPISSGFVSIDTISRFQNDVRIRNCKLDNFLKIKSKFKVLSNPIFSLDEFDDFVRRLLIEEEDEGDESSRIGINIEELLNMRSDLIRIIEKYTGDGIEDEEEGEDGFKSVTFWKNSKKWPNREHCLVMMKTWFVYSTDELEF